MKGISRRSFVSVAAAGLASLTTVEEAEAARIYHTADWHMAEFNALLRSRQEIKQMWDITEVDDGDAFAHMCNALNGLHFGFGVPNEQIKLVAAIRSKASVMNLNDAMWEKYRIGEVAKIEDPRTKKLALRNIFFPSDAGNPPKYKSTDPNDDNSFEEDSSIQTLQRRGVQLLACHIAVGAMGEFVIEKLKLKISKEEISDEFHKNLLPGVLVVPSMVSAIPMLQTKGHFSYIRM